MKKILSFLAVASAAFIGSTALVTAQLVPGLPSDPVYFAPQQPVNGSQNDDDSFSNMLIAEADSTWSTLQDAMQVQTLNVSNDDNSASVVPNLENILKAQFDIIDYKRAYENKYAFKNSPCENNDFRSNFRIAWMFPVIMENKVAAEAEVTNVDVSNPVVIPSVSILFSAYWRTVLEARVCDVIIDLNGNYTGVTAADLNQTPEYLACNKALLNGPVDVATWERIYSDINVLEFNTVIGEVRLTADESAAFTDFQTKLSASYDAACKNYLDQETPVLNEKKHNPAKALQKMLLRSEEVHANVATFSILEQGCLYEYIQVLVTRRDHQDNPNEAATFAVLQQKMDQFLSNVDVHNPVALLEAQMDMIDYENVVRGDKTK